MNLLVAGGAGFIGSSFCRHILNGGSGDKVSVLDALTYAGNLATIEDLEADERFRFHQGRIENKDLLCRIVRDDHIDAVVNFAAETHNDRSLLEARDFLNTNIMGVQALLECAREMKLQKLIQVSTDEVYGSIDEGKFKEESPVMPNTPYSASKAAGDLLCRAHFVSFGTPVVVTRGGNTYGPYQYPEKLISFFISRLMDEKKVPVYGDGSQVREWIHVSDHCSGVEAALRSGMPGEIYNIADENERPNMEVVRLLLSELSRPSDLIKHIHDPRQGAHDKRYSMSAEKLRALGWKPKVSFNQGMHDTVQWYVDNERWWRPITRRVEYQAFVKTFYGPGLGSDL